MSRVGYAYSSIAVTGSEIVLGVRTTAAVLTGFNIYEVLVSGQAGTSTPVRLDVSRATTATAMYGVVVPPGMLNAVSDAAPASLVSNKAAWTTTPTAGTSLINLPFNAFGGIIRWVAAPGSELVAIGSAAGTTGTTQGMIVLTSRAGSATVDGHLLVEEL